MSPAIRPQHQEQIEAFAAVVAELAGILEAKQPAPIEPAQLLELVSRLYSLALALPDAPAGTVDFDRDSDEAYEIDQAERRTIYERAAALVGDRQYYWLQFDPYAAQPDAKPEKPVVGDLADDLADIYGDVVPPLRAWRSGTAEWQAIALYEWRFNLHFHWGKHAVEAITALHAWSYGPT